MKFFKKKTQVQNDDWKYWDFYDEDGYYGLNFLDATYLDTARQVGFKREYYLKVLIPENRLVNGRFPTPEVNKELVVLEDNLVALLEKEKVNCKQTHRCLYYGAKRMLFEVADVVDFEKVLGAWKKQLVNFELEVIEEESWIIYKEMQPDAYAWQQMGNREVYEKLVGHGSNPEKDHLIEHAIFGEPANLKQLEQELLKEGGKTLTLEDDLLEMGFEGPLDLDQLHNRTYFLMDKAAEFGCKYDGWCAAIVK